MNKNPNFQNKLSIFETRNQKSQNNNDIQKKIESKEDKNTKNIKVNEENKLNSVKKEEKSNEVKNVHNQINTINKNIQSEKEKINAQEKIDKDRNINESKNSFDNKIVPREQSSNFKDKISKFNKTENEREKDLKNITRVKSTSIQEKVNMISQPKKEIKTNNESNNNIKKETNKEINTNTNIKNDNVTQIQKPEQNEIKQEKNEFKTNTVKQRAATIYSPKPKESNIKTTEKEKDQINKNENKNNDNKVTISSNNNFKNRILNFETRKNDKIDLNSKEKKGKSIDPSLFESIKLLYQPKKIETKPVQKNLNTSNNNNLNIKNSTNNNIDKNENKNTNLADKKEEKEKTPENSVSTETSTNIQDIKNKPKNDEMSVQQVPKKLNLKEIFKNMNIDQVASKVKADKREQIIKFAQQKKEEEKKMEVIEQEVGSDNENDNENEEEEKEEKEDKDEEEILEGEKEIDEKEEKEEKEEKNKEVFPKLEPEKINPQVNEVKEGTAQEGDKKINNSNISDVQKEKEKENNVDKRRKSTLNIPNNLESKLKSFMLQNNKVAEKVNKNIDPNKNEDEKEKEKEKKPIPEVDNNINKNENNEFKYNKTIKLNKSIGFKENNTYNPYNDNFQFDEKKPEINLACPTFVESNKNKFEKLIQLNENISSENEEIFLGSVTTSKTTNTKNSLCESFFLASFPRENGQIIDNSEGDDAECNHFLCSFLPAMQPEILYKYPEADIKGLEINNLAASICFPNGIKVCYDEKEDSIKTVKNYRSSFTNQVGDRFFTVIYHFYLKMENKDFEESYSNTPIKNKLLSYKDETHATLSEESEEDICDKINVYIELSTKRNYVYIPFCLCLISKYPFIEQMEKCLESIMMSINGNEPNLVDLNEVITYIVKSIPAPPYQSKIYFPLPYFNKFIEIQQPYFRDIAQFGDNPIIILNHFSISHILCLFKLLIFEQKVLIIGKNNDLISQIILNFVSLLYPFEWIHTFIPIMSGKMLKFLQAFLPFFNGINKSLFNKAKPILAKAPKGIFIFNVDEDKIDINSNLKTSKKIKVSSYINKHYPNFPKHIENLIIKELKIIKHNHDHAKENYDKYNANIKIKNLFMEVFTELLCDYKNYSYIIDDYPVFNSFLYIKDKKTDKNFFKEFTSTQLFQMFIQNSLFNDKNKVPYFEDRLNQFNALKKAGRSSSYIYSNLFSSFNDEYNSFFKINKIYIIKPYFIKGFKEYEESYISKNKSINLNKIAIFLSNKYEGKNDVFINNHGVLRENKRIMEKPIELSNENDPNEYDIYLIPGQKIENLIDDKNNKSPNPSNNIETKKTKTIKMGFISDEESNNENTIRYSQTIFYKENDLTEDEKDEIKDNIKEIMTRVYRSDVTKIEDDKKTIIDSMKKQFGREYFVSILNTGNNNDKTIKLVIEKSYLFFCDIIFNTLLDILKLDEHKNINIAIKLLKASLFIKTIKNKKEYILSDELFVKLEKYSLFVNYNFWERWVEDDMTESDIEILKLQKKAKDENVEYFYIDEESENYKSYIKHSCDIIEGLTSIMMKMKLKNNFIYETTSELCKQYIFEESSLKQVLQEIVNELQLFKKLSN